MTEFKFLAGRLNGFFHQVIRLIARFIARRLFYICFPEHFTGGYVSNNTRVDSLDLELEELKRTKKNRDERKRRDRGSVGSVPS